jgi:hypothetical protein
MSEHVEARSLASLNFLAANPPQYPVNPTEERHESLVLYISRVPGTRGGFPPLPFGRHLTASYPYCADRYFQTSSCPRSSLRSKM